MKRKKDFLDVVKFLLTFILVFTCVACIKKPVQTQKINLPPSLAGKWSGEYSSSILSVGIPFTFRLSQEGRDLEGVYYTTTGIVGRIVGKISLNNKEMSLNMSHSAYLCHGGFNVSAKIIEAVKIAAVFEGVDCIGYHENGKLTAMLIPE